MGGKDERHQQLRRVPLEPHRHDDHDRQQSRDRAVDADQRGQHGHEAHGQEQKARPALLARTPDQELPGPGGDAGHLEPGADDEERGDEDDGRIAEAAQRLAAGSARRVAQSASAVAMATTTTGSLFQTNRTTAAAMMAAV